MLITPYIVSNEADGRAITDAATTRFETGNQRVRVETLPDVPAASPEPGSPRPVPAATPGASPGQMPEPETPPVPLPAPQAAPPNAPAPPPGRQPVPAAGDAGPPTAGSVPKP